MSRNLPTEADDTITLTHTDSASSHERQLEVPRRLGSVRLTQEIGRGGMGVVWLGRDELLGRDVAVKFLLNIVTGTDDPGFVRFMDGARAATAARHPSLTTIYLADTIQNTPYLVMEYINGASLSDVIRANGALSSSASLTVLHDVCDALGELHDRRIIHRDIKPGNVLIDLEGRVFLTDFGLACERPAEGQDVVGVSGTPAYMAPEMFDGTVSERSDVYALGLMTYQMLTGVRAFNGPLAQVRRQHMLKALPTEPLEHRGVADDLITLLERATNKDALFRYKTARHFYERLVEALPETRTSSADRRALAALVTQARNAGEAIDPIIADGSSGSSYYDTLSKRAAKKRGSSDFGDQLSNLSSDTVANQIIPVGETIPFDLNCVNCDYNLRGLHPGGKCPECANLIAASLTRSRLLFAPRAWLSALQLGLMLVLIFMTVDIAIPLGLNLVGLGVTRLSSDPRPILQSASILFTIAGWIQLIILGVGSFFLTYPKKNVIRLPLEALFSWLVRLAAFAIILVQVVKPIILNLVEVQMSALMLTLVDSVTTALTFAAISAYLATLLSRIPQPSLSRSLSRLAIGFIGFTLITLVGGLLLTSFLINRPMIQVAASLLLGALQITTIYLLTQARSLLKMTQTRQSELTTLYAEIPSAAPSEQADEH